MGSPYYPLLEAWAVIRNAFRVKTNRLVLLGPVDNVVYILIS